VAAICLANFVGQHFPRNLSPNFRLYIRERPEMTSSQRAANQGQNKKRKLNHEQTKH